MKNKKSIAWMRWDGKEDPPTATRTTTTHWTKRVVFLFFNIRPRCHLREHIWTVTDHRSAWLPVFPFLKKKRKKKKKPIFQCWTPTHTTTITNTSFQNTTTEEKRKKKKEKKKDRSCRSRHVEPTTIIGCKRIYIPLFILLFFSAPSLFLSLIISLSLSLSLSSANSFVCMYEGWKVLKHIEPNDTKNTYFLIRKVLKHWTKWNKKSIFNLFLSLM